MESRTSLLNRLDGLRWRLWAKNLRLGIAQTIGVTLASVLAGGALDYTMSRWGYDIRSLLSSLLLTWLVAVVFQFFEPTVRFWPSRLSLAAWLESHDKSLRGRLVPAVSFLESKKPPRSSTSATLQDFALAQTEELSILPPVDSPSTTRWSALAILATSVLALLFFWAPTIVGTALERQFAPWIPCSWPKQYSLEWKTFPPAVNVGDTFRIEIRDTHGRAIPNAKLQVTSSRGPILDFTSGSSNAQGTTFEVSGIPAAATTLRLRAHGGDDLLDWRELQVVEPWKAPSLTVEVTPPSHSLRPSYPSGSPIACVRGSAIQFTFEGPTGSLSLDRFDFEQYELVTSDRQTIPLKWRQSEAVSGRITIASSAWIPSKSDRYRIARRYRARRESDSDIVWLNDAPLEVQLKEDQGPIVELNAETVEPILSPRGSWNSSGTIRDDLRVAEAFVVWKANTDQLERTPISLTRLRETGDLLPDETQFTIHWHGPNAAKDSSLWANERGANITNLIAPEVVGSQSPKIQWWIEAVDSAGQVTKTEPRSLTRISQSDAENAIAQRIHVVLRRIRELRDMEKEIGKDIESATSNQDWTALLSRQRNMESSLFRDENSPTRSLALAASEAGQSSPKGEESKSIVAAHEILETRARPVIARILGKLEDRAKARPSDDVTDLALLHGQTMTAINDAIALLEKLVGGARLRERLVTIHARELEIQESVQSENTRGESKRLASLAAEQSELASELSEIVRGEMQLAPSSRAVTIAKQLRVADTAKGAAESIYRMQLTKALREISDVLSAISQMIDSLNDVDSQGSMTNTDATTNRSTSVEEAIAEQGRISEAILEAATDREALAEIADRQDRLSRAIEDEASEAIQRAREAMADAARLARQALPDRSHDAARRAEKELRSIRNADSQNRDEAALSEAVSQLVQAQEDVLNETLSPFPNARVPLWAKQWIVADRAWRAREDLANREGERIVLDSAHESMLEAGASLLTGTNRERIIALEEGALECLYDLRDSLDDSSETSTASNEEESKPAKQAATGNENQSTKKPALSRTEVRLVQRRQTRILSHTVALLEREKNIEDQGDKESIENTWGNLARQEDGLKTILETAFARTEKGDKPNANEASLEDAIDSLDSQIFGGIPSRQKDQVNAKPSTAPEEESVSKAISLMTSVRDRMLTGERSAPLVGEQEEILAILAKLLEAGSNEGDNASEQSSQSQRQQKPGAESTAKREKSNKASDGQRDATWVDPKGRSIWGHLPPRAAEAAKAIPNLPFPSKYRAEIEAYYEKLSRRRED